jgi:predicted DNA-binding transcriptional regulator AlpA
MANATQPKFSTVKDVAQRYRQSISKTWQDSKNGVLPTPIKISANCTRWVNDELDAHDAKLIASRKSV